MIFDLPSMLNPVIFMGLLHLNILKCCWWLPVPVMSGSIGLGLSPSLCVVYTSSLRDSHP